MNSRRSAIITELWLPEFARSGKFVSIFLRFWKNDPLWWNFQTFVPKVYMATLIDVVMLKVCEIDSTGNWRKRALFTWQKNKISLLRGSRPKAGGVIADCVNTVFYPVEYFHNSPRRKTRRIMKSTGRTQPPQPITPNGFFTLNLCSALAK